MDRQKKTEPTSRPSTVNYARWVEYFESEMSGSNDQAKCDGLIRRLLFRMAPGDRKESGHMAGVNLFNTCVKNISGQRETYAKILMGWNSLEIKQKLDCWTLINKSTENSIHAIGMMKDRNWGVERSDNIEIVLSGGSEFLTNFEGLGEEFKLEYNVANNREGADRPDRSETYSYDTVCDLLTILEGVATGAITLPPKWNKISQRTGVTKLSNFCHAVAAAEEGRGQLSGRLPNYSNAVSSFIHSIIMQQPIKNNQGMSPGETMLKAHSFGRNPAMCLAVLSVITGCQLDELKRVARMLNTSSVSKQTYLELTTMRVLDTGAAKVIWGTASGLDKYACPFQYSMSRFLDDMSALDSSIIGRHTLSNRPVDQAIFMTLAYRLETLAGKRHTEIKTSHGLWARSVTRRFESTTLQVKNGGTNMYSTTTWKVDSTTKEILIRVKGRMGYSSEPKAPKAESEQHSEPKPTGLGFGMPSQSTPTVDPASFIGGMGGQQGFTKLNVPHGLGLSGDATPRHPLDEVSDGPAYAAYKSHPTAGLTSQLSMLSGQIRENQDITVRDDSLNMALADMLAQRSKIAAQIQALESQTPRRMSESSDQAKLAEIRAQLVAEHAASAEGRRSRGPSATRASQRQPSPVKNALQRGSTGVSAADMARLIQEANKAI